MVVLIKKKKNNNVRGSEIRYSLDLINQSEQLRRLIATR